jgi:carbohydrate diacid regulator
MTISVPTEKGEPMTKINCKPLDELDFRLILSLAENNMRATETSYALYVHRGTVMYRIAKIKALTGLDPQKFYDLCKLVEMAKKEVE